MKFDRITRDPERLGGQPCIRDLRITVRRALQAIALYPDREELRREYPELEDEDLRQALEFAAAQLEDTTIDLPWGAVVSVTPVGLRLRRLPVARESLGDEADQP